MQRPIPSSGKPTIPMLGPPPGLFLPRFVTIGIIVLLTLASVVLALAIYAEVFGGPVKEFLCELADGRMSGNGRNCVGAL